MIAALFMVLVVFGQGSDKAQVKVARDFLIHAAKGEKDEAWKLFDSKNVPEVSRNDLDNAIDQLKHDLALYDDFELQMSGVKVVNDLQLSLYTFKAVSRSKNVVDNMMVDVVFFKNSMLVGGIQPKNMVKDNTASTSRGTETELQGPFRATIEGTEYQINGINLVHFEKEQGIIAIQVEYELPADQAEMKRLADRDGPKFARYLVQNGYVEKAQSKAKELGMKLLDQIGVSFYENAKKQGYNTLVKPKDYR